MQTAFNPDFSDGPMYISDSDAEDGRTVTDPTEEDFHEPAIEIEDDDDTDDYFERVIMLPKKKFERHWLQPIGGAELKSFQQTAMNRCIMYLVCETLTQNYSFICNYFFVDSAKGHIASYDGAFCHTTRTSDMDTVRS